MTQLNIALEGLFAVIYFRETSGSSLQLCFSFIAKTLKIHNKL
jgi:hypothetical protein